MQLLLELENSGNIQIIRLPLSLSQGVRKHNDLSRVGKKAELLLQVSLTYSGAGMERLMIPGLHQLLSGLYHFVPSAIASPINE